MTTTAEQVFACTPIPVLDSFQIPCNVRDSQGGSDFHQTPHLEEAETRLAE
ncbi:MAG: hypothetical protein JWO38_2303 [Gemmataceae bacterium]|nr:hypothetical protein [Gemmataceae bacterium]